MSSHACSPTAEDLADYYAGRSTLLRRPADKGDFRFEITALEEPEMGATHVVEMVDDRGHVVENYTTDDPYGHVAQFRECQATPFEERYAPFGSEWQRERAAA